jgi:hypothetical protein
MRDISKRQSPKIATAVNLVLANRLPLQSGKPFDAEDRYEVIDRVIDTYPTKTLKKQLSFAHLPGGRKLPNYRRLPL